MVKQRVVLCPVSAPLPISENLHHPEFSEASTETLELGVIHQGGRRGPETEASVV